MKIIVIILLFISSLFASIGKVSAVTGDATIQRTSQNLIVTIGLELEEKDIIRTASNSKVQLIFKDNTIITVGKNSALDIAEYLYDTQQPKNSKTDFNFFKGAFKTITGKIGKINKEKFKLRTKSASIGIRGTVILGDQNQIVCLVGGLAVKEAGKLINVDAKQMTKTKPNTAPTPAKNITNKDIAKLEESLEPEEKKEDKKVQEKDKQEPSQNNKENKKSKEEAKSLKKKNDKSKKSGVNKKSEKNSNTKQQSSNNQVETKKSSNQASSKSTNSKTSLSKSIKTSRIKVTQISEKPQGTNVTASVPSQKVKASFYQTSFSAPINNVKAVEDTAHKDEAFKSGTVTVDNITSDDVMTTTESNSTVTITGTAKGGDISEGDSVSVTINGTKYSSTVNTNGSWSIDISGSDLYNDTNFDVVVASSNNSGIVGTSEANSTHTKATIYSQTGAFLGAYYDSASTSQSFIQKEDTFSSNRELTLFSFKDDLSREKQSDGTASTINIDSSITKASSFDTPGVGNYTGTVDVGTVAFTYTLDDSSTFTGNYTVVADNTGEFFVAYHDGSVNGTTEFNELFVTGTSTPSANIDASKIYVYKEFKFMEATKDSTSKLSQTKISSDTAYEYYNAAIGSLTHLNTNIYEKGAESFIAGDGTNVKAYQNEYIYNAGQFEYDNFNETTGTTSFKGTDVQGLMIDVSGTTYSSFGKAIESTSKTIDALGASFYEKSLTATSTGTMSLTGYTSYFIDDESLNSSILTRNSTSDFSLSVDRSSGTITGEINKTQTNEPKMNLSGTVGNLSSYYITDDLFGVVGITTGSTYFDGTTTYNLTDKTGTLIAVPDGGFDANDNPVFLDDDSSWGYWTAEYTDTSDNQKFVSPLSTWVAGVQTSTAVMDNLMDVAATNTAYTFTGKVLGAVETTTGLEAIKVDANNIVNMTFNLGGGTNSMSGTMDFTSATTTWDLEMTSNHGDISNTSFTGSLHEATASPVTGSFDGKYYGETTLNGVTTPKSVGGSFNVTDGTNNARGVFKATK